MIFSVNFHIQPTYHHLERKASRIGEKGYIYIYKLTGTPTSWWARADSTSIQSGMRRSGRRVYVVALM